MASGATITGDTMLIIRRIGFALLAGAAVLVWAYMGPDRTSVEDHADRLTEIASDDDANNALTEGAPQQEVVSGWTSLESLEVISKDITRFPDARRATLLMLLVVPPSLLFATSPNGPVAPRGVPVGRTGPATTAATPGAPEASGQHAGP